MTTTDELTEEIEHLDFDTPCVLPVTPTQQCERPAVWMMKIRGHCMPDAIDELPICQEHLDFIQQATRVFLCRDCMTYQSAAEHIVSLTKIKP